MFLKIKYTEIENKIIVKMVVKWLKARKVGKGLWLDKLKKKKTFKRVREGLGKTIEQNKRENNVE